ncbi:MAG: histidinol dehydrogenase [Flavobacteriales bacterium]|jgi:histidinol dehydrogenase|uniref:histidinol dehydrogenase n=1 Tax=Blattabacterium sp. (Mastotermes darwiniensis) TaxID=39768 RepID=UPI000231DFC2|nr:histidinol dehydrogenase [Blattabacterium sp. (Mastotermes darwiniensis)]AER40474.1 histidinol dehydrogenase [Blattabacterium sp. (Mastotermes darwiniensis) str. MADAR]MDR1805010.1 histidinol dehydrogenase [Flavobacteriales bacterium]
MDIQVYTHPPFNTWKSIIERPKKEDLPDVSTIINNVRIYGDIALKSYTNKYDGLNIRYIQVTKEDIDKASMKISNSLKESIEIAYENILCFHQKQIHKESKIEILPGVTCWRKSVPIEKVGFYIPGGSAPLLSTVLMLGIPAKLAGCEDIILCSPPNKNGSIHPSILYTAKKYIGITRIYQVGGAQAIAAMAYGTESIPSVYKIFGPGNSYVTMAKQIVSKNLAVAIDIPAGPSESVILADSTANPEYVASDFISQSEHDMESYILLVTVNEYEWIETVKSELKKQLINLSNNNREHIIKKSLEKSKMIILSSLEECINLINQVAPEHLIINCNNASYWSEKIKNAGSIFLGNYSPISVGDYASGTNHVLPTSGYAKFYSGVSVNSFIKKITVQKISKKGLRSLSKCINVLSSEEGLIAHQKSINIRLKN